jgi:hypothetical protein
VIVDVGLALVLLSGSSWAMRACSREAWLDGRVRDSREVIGLRNSEIPQADALEQAKSESVRDPENGRAPADATGVPVDEVVR